MPVILTVGNNLLGNIVLVSTSTTYYFITCIFSYFMVSFTCFTASRRRVRMLCRSLNRESSPAIIENMNKLVLIIHKNIL